MAGVSLRPGLRAEGREAWLRLGRGWETLTGVDGDEGLRGNLQRLRIQDTAAKDGNEAGVNGEEGLDRQVVVQPGLGRG